MRVKKAAVVKPITAMGGGSTYWTNREKERLLKALRKYGTGDLEKIAEVVGSRDVMEVKGFLEASRVRMGGGKDRRLMDAVNKCLHNWQQYLHRIKIPKVRNTDKTMILTEVAEAYAEQDFLQPTHELEPNFGELHRYLVDVMRDQVPAELSVTDSWVLRHVMKSVMDTVKKMDLKAEKEVVQAAVIRVENSSTWVKPSTKWKRKKSAKSTEEAGHSEPSPEATVTMIKLAEDDPSCMSISYRSQPQFPTWQKRIDNLESIWNPFQVPRDVLHREHEHIVDMWHSL